MTGIPRYQAQKLALLGDLHGRWNAHDNAFFDRAGFDLLLFVGDLGSGTRKDGLAVIRQISRLQSRGLVLPGNNDAEHLPHLSAELAHQAGRAQLLRAMRRNAAAGIEPCGYSCHQLITDAGTVSMIAARPCPTGGSVLSFAPMLERTYGIHSMEESAARLCQLVDQAPDPSVLFFAHNGPKGVGGRLEDPWSRDFSAAAELEGPSSLDDDWGDDDLREAIDYARLRGKKVLGVIAGHMHRTPQGSKRPLLTERDGIRYVNPACVPRIVMGADGERHHYVRMHLSPDALELSEHWVQVGTLA